ncbi:class I SAM-dependent methyltransferase [Hydrogenophaga sp. OTU3427]|uniref:class I SAM-dependent methyltransferase n=1 Tax=Hydrogenophaga sp. OTU3427 TaxID=3043856 RepID=UPI00313CC7B0
MWTTLWPLPALLAWGAAWGTWLAGRTVGMSDTLALVLATVTGVVFSLLGGSVWRKLMMALGFPVSWLLAHGGAVSANISWWLLPLGLFLWLYPPASWRDAPLYPTPHDAFEGLREHVPLPLAGRVLDAGCGLGDGLIALERAYPDVHLHGVERSTPLRWLCALRCRWAQVRGGDLWADDWSGYDMVYLFQRPETMPRALEKAARELQEGAWLASLEFEATEWVATMVWTCPDDRPLWLYQAPLVRKDTVKADQP